MTSASPPTTVPPRPRWGSPLGWLGHRIAHRPWHLIGLWIAILLVCLLPAMNVGAVITGSFSNPLPSSDQSVRAQNAFVSLFPDAQSSPSSSIILLEWSQITGPVGKNATLAVTAALAQDAQLRNVSSIESLYSAYSQYLAGQVLLGWGFLGHALASNPSLTTSVNDTASAVWAPAALYLHYWNSTVANLTPSTPVSAADLPAYNLTETALASNALETAVLAAFYYGDGASTP